MEIFLKVLPYFFATVGTFITVFLKGFQHKNVINNLYAHTFVTSYMMAMTDVLLIGLVAKSDWTIAFASGAGGSFGMITAMFIHNRYVTGKNHV